MAMNWTTCLRAVIGLLSSQSPSRGRLGGGLTQDLWSKWFMMFQGSHFSS